VKAAGMIAREIGDATRALRSGFLARNEEAKQALEARIEQLQTSLRHAGQIATLAAEYTRAHQKVRALAELCSRATAFIRENMDSLVDRGAAQYQVNWRTLDMIFDGITQNRDVPSLAALDRQRWYDDQDRAQIDLRLRDFGLAYERGKGAIERRAARDAEDELKTMVEALREVDLMLDNTLYAKMFDALEALDGRA
jgi:hypothetical protein